MFLLPLSSSIPPIPSQRRHVVANGNLVSKKKLKAFEKIVNSNAEVAVAKAEAEKAAAEGVSGSDEDEDLEEALEKDEL
jgi:hypothetical protein